MNRLQIKYIISEVISDALKVDKNHQLSVIKDNNPASDDIHTWIRSEEDIKTYEEAINDNGGIEDLTPDYKSDDIKKALKTGKVIVHSSYPIKPGIFVTPSRMEAQNYAGNGRIYSKIVNLSDVAWIDPLQGQYIG